MPLQVRGAFGGEDLAFAQELAARAAMAVDNARHYPAITSKKPWRVPPSG
ncbi:hypothetical protein [Streptomyces violarus]|uniref:GAF domain-containing protein n=1 Tax=Streptomyces violarus TaxID=67380 RepID=A0A7W4ZUH3_9ACTN|nr:MULTISPECIES: hypothetical protein [Streptomyces]MBB3078823.1 GAF domain-containing protein [Streptomyces violarus]WRU03338.1 hypothetical protein VJ737_39130 [Streptomyces sp. CGMCC 4.1772]